MSSMPVVNGFNDSLADKAEFLTQLLRGTKVVNSTGMIHLLVTNGPSVVDIINTEVAHSSISQAS